MHCTQVERVAELESRLSTTRSQLEGAAGQAAGASVLQQRLAELESELRCGV